MSGGGVAGDAVTSDAVGAAAETGGAAPPRPVHRIDDWDAPWLPALARAINRIPGPIAARLLPLDPERLLDRARRRTGLSDLGGTGPGELDFREPMDALLAELAADPGLTPMGRLAIRSMFQQLLTARLRLEDVWARHPGIASVEVRAPVVIVGLPRTGTTHLHNLISRVPTLRSLPLWESIEPLRPAGPRGRGPDLRRLRTALRIGQIDWLLPLLSLMHELEVDLPHEELQLSAQTFRSFYFEGAYRVPRYREWYRSRDHAGAYRYLRRILATLQWLRGPERWVLKSPQHVDQLDALVAAFPDARIVRTHRDPVRVIVSIATMLTYTRRALYRDVDVRAEARGWAERIEGMLRASIAQADRLPADRILDVPFHAFMADPVGTAGRVLAFAGEPLGAGERRVLEAFHRRNPRGKRGRVRYDFEGLGLDPGELRERLSFYLDRFGLPAETD